MDDSTSPDGKRNRYFRNKRLQAADFRLEQQYGIGRRRLLSRGIAGWGVVHGFKLTLALNTDQQPTGKLRCGAGLGLDQHGRELLRTCDQALAAKEFIWLDASGMPLPEKPVPTDPAGDEYLLQVHYAERRTDLLKVGDGCGCGEQEFNYLSETVLFSLLPRYQGDCDSAQDACRSCDCPAAVSATPGAPRRHPQSCLCEWSASATPHKDDHSVRHDDLCYVLNDALALAVVRVAVDECGNPSFTELVDACSPRRLVKSNDMLFDLIRGCDLTRISAISWGEEHGKEVDWKAFKKYFPRRTTDLNDDRDEEVRMQAVPTTFRVTFSRPVLSATLRAACVSFRVLTPDPDSGWLTSLQVPVAGFRADTTDPAETCTSAIIEVRAGWCDDEIWGHESVFRKPTQIEIEIRGDLILDCRGEAVDANAVGLRATPSGNGTPGGNYLSTFQVRAR